MNIQSINIVIAEKIMGWQYNVGGGYSSHCMHLCGDNDWNPLTDLNDAISAIDTLCQDKEDTHYEITSSDTAYKLKITYEGKVSNHCTKKADNRFALSRLIAESIIQFI
jgi:hypothetical protein